MCACFRMWYMNCQQCASGTRKSWSSQKKLAQLCTKPLPTCYYHLQLFSQRKKFRLLPIGQMLLSFLLVFLMLECLSLCNDIWWLWQRHDNSDAVMKMLCLFATRRAVDLAEWLVVEATGQLPRPLRWCGWSNWQWWWWWWWFGWSIAGQLPRPLRWHLEWWWWSSWECIIPVQWLELFGSWPLMLFVELFQKCSNTQTTMLSVVKAGSRRRVEKIESKEGKLDIVIENHLTFWLLWLSITFNNRLRSPKDKLGCRAL